MEDQIKALLSAISDQPIQSTKPINSSRYNKSNSFTELSDWSNKHKYINESIILPRIQQQLCNVHDKRSVNSSLSCYQQSKKSTASNSPVRSIDIKFGLPQGLKGFQKSFYENYIKQKSQRKGSKIHPSEYLSIQQQLKIHLHPQKHSNSTKLQSQMARQSIINRVMNRKNRLKRQHFLQQYLVASSMNKQQAENMN